MKFSDAVASLLLPLRVLASPIADPGPHAVPRDQHATGAAPTPIEARQSKADLEVRALFERSTARCKIVNVSSYANCRSGPGTGYAATHIVRKGEEFVFDCYKKGTCVEGNW
jgi:uncharacterized membrane protein